MRDIHRAWSENNIATKPYAEEHFLSAEKFLKKLSPSNPFWNQDGFTSEDWIFRGQRADLPLVPSALRDGKLDEWIEKLQINKKIPEGPHIDDRIRTDLKRINCGEIQQVYKEFLVFQKFTRYADENGIPLPDWSMKYRDTWASLNKPGTKVTDILLKPATWPEQEQQEILAIAQHFDVQKMKFPTRLLDWTMEPAIAAYFTVRSEEPEDNSIVIWALNRKLVCTNKFKNYNPIEYIDPPKFYNRNCYRQNGVLTFIREFAQNCKGTRFGLEDNLKAKWFGWKKPLHKMTLDPSERPRLKALLAAKGIDENYCFQRG